MCCSVGLQHATRQLDACHLNAVAQEKTNDNPENDSAVRQRLRQKSLHALVTNCTFAFVSSEQTTPNKHTMKAVFRRTHANSPSHPALADKLGPPCLRPPQRSKSAPNTSSFTSSSAAATSSSADTNSSARTAASSSSTTAVLTPRPIRPPRWHRDGGGGGGGTVASLGWSRGRSSRAGPLRGHGWHAGYPGLEIAVRSESTPISRIGFACKYVTCHTSRVAGHGSQVRCRT